MILANTDDELDDEPVKRGMKRISVNLMRGQVRMAMFKQCAATGCFELFDEAKVAVPLLLDPWFAAIVNVLQPRRAQS